MLLRNAAQDDGHESVSYLKSKLFREHEGYWRVHIKVAPAAITIAITAKVFEEKDFLFYGLSLKGKVN